MEPSKCKLEEFLKCNPEYKDFLCGYIDEQKKNFIKKRK